MAAAELNVFFFTNLLREYAKTVAGRHVAYQQPSAERRARRLRRIYAVESDGGCE
jgi:hypothetical protein